MPNDPYGNASQYWPQGLGQLTPKGRARMFAIGQYLRARYGDYLGDKYAPMEVFARSSGKDRCLASAQLVLAGK